ncbi:MAG: hypothetical protein QOH97_2646 [Actinoplanes sp.]|jgi:hypothetical protein|nr:hypothetical protein [Actinoplanes sp.]
MPGAIGVGLDNPTTATDLRTGSDPNRGQQWDLPAVRVVEG